MVGGAWLPGAVTLNVSVRHCVLTLAGRALLDLATLPLSTLNCEAVTVEGPAIENVLKSRRSWRKRSTRLHTMYLQEVVCLCTCAPGRCCPRRGTT